MTKLLALEASSETCSVTLHTPSFSETLESSRVRSHSQLLLPYVDQLLSRHSLDLDKLDFIACSQGPGSFTGLRICFSIAQGLAFGANLPIVTVCSLESMARMSQIECCERDILVPLDDERPCVSIAVLDARMDQVYWAAFYSPGSTTSPDSNQSQVLIKPCLQFTSEATEKIGRIIQQYSNCTVSLVGNGASQLQTAGLDTSNIIVRPNVIPTSKMAVDLALKTWLSEGAVSCTDAELIYLRDTVSWKKRTRIRQE